MAFRLRLHHVHSRHIPTGNTKTRKASEVLFHNCSSHIHNLQTVIQNFPHLVFSSTHKTHNHYNTHFRKRLRADTFLSLSHFVDFTTHFKESGSMLSRIQNSFSPTFAQHMLQTTCTAPRSNVCVFVCVRERERERPNTSKTSTVKKPPHLQNGPLCVCAYVSTHVCVRSSRLWGVGRVGCVTAAV